MANSESERSLAGLLPDRRNLAQSTRGSRHPGCDFGRWSNAGAQQRPACESGKYLVIASTEVDVAVLFKYEVADRVGKVKRFGNSN